MTSMFRVYNTMIGPDSSPVQGGTISIDLVWNRSEQDYPASINPMYFIEGRWASRSDANGLWEISLVPNSLITPLGNTAYRITEKPKRYSYFPTIYYIEVPDAATPIDYYVGDITVSKPDWVNP